MQFLIIIFSAYQLIYIVTHNVALRNGQIGARKRLFDDLFSSLMAVETVLMEPTAQLDEFFWGLHRLQSSGLFG